MLYSFCDISRLPLSQQDLAVLRADGFNCISDLLFLRFSPLKRMGDITTENWKTLLSELVDSNFGGNLDDILTYFSISVGLRKFQRKKKGMQMDVLVVNVMNEKYVVSTIKAGKHPNPSKIYRCIANGVVFNDEAEAHIFARQLMEFPRCRELRTEKITSACETLYLTRVQQQTHHYFLFQLGENPLRNGTVQSQLRKAPFYVTSTIKARVLAQEYVRQINHIFSYEIAQYQECMLSDEDIPIPMEYSLEEYYFVDREAYGRALDAEISRLQGEFFSVSGKESGFDFARNVNYPCLKTEIRRTEEFLRVLEELPQELAQADLSYYRGYRDALYTAAALQPLYEIHTASIRALVYTDGDADTGTWEQEYSLSSLEMNACVRESTLALKIRLSIFTDWQQLMQEARPGDQIVLLYQHRIAFPVMEKQKEVYEKFGTDLELCGTGSNLLRFLAKSILPASCESRICSSWLSQAEEDLPEEWIRDEDDLEMDLVEWENEEE